jgi:hypothetical protein
VRLWRTCLGVAAQSRRNEVLHQTVLLVLLGGALHFLTAALDVLAEAFHRVAGGQAERNNKDAQYGDDFFHDFFLSG